MSNRKQESRTVLLIKLDIVLTKNVLHAVLYDVIHDDSNAQAHDEISDRSSSTTIGAAPDFER
jgi:hypothetical protein